MTTDQADSQNDPQAEVQASAQPVAAPVDAPNPSAGGTYTRDPVTGELTRVGGPQDPQE